MSSINLFPEQRARCGDFFNPIELKPRIRMLPDKSESSRIRADAARIRADAVRIREENMRICTRSVRILEENMRICTHTVKRFPFYTQTVQAALQHLQNRQGECQQAEETAKAANRAKDRFLAVVSHELRNPLSHILAITTDLLADPATPDEFQGYLETIRRNIELEARLVNDLLDFQRIDWGKVQLDREMVDAHDVLHQALEICHAIIHASGLKVEVDLSAVRHYVSADPRRLQQVFWNLIENAAKFTPAEGTLTIRSRDVDGPEGSRWLVEFADTGLGIEPAVLPRIFDPFEQGEALRRGRPRGLGLGLAICRTMVEAHGGHLTVASPGRDQGTTFTLELEAVPAPVSGSESVPTPAVAAPDQRGLRILLVENNREFLNNLARILRMRGHEVSAASSLASAWTAASEESFELLISDIELPDGTGLDLMRELGGDRGVPGIALSGFGSEEDIQESRAAGFRMHLTKPVDIRTLELAIIQVMTSVPHPEQFSLVPSPSVR